MVYSTFFRRKFLYGYNAIKLPIFKCLTVTFKSLQIYILISRLCSSSHNILSLFLCLLFPPVLLHHSVYYYVAELVQHESLLIDHHECSSVCLSVVTIVTKLLDRVHFNMLYRFLFVSRKKSKFLDLDLGTFVPRGS